jgi:FKBP-type peptidyl-prolyl cis-trans isomerase FklB
MKQLLLFVTIGSFALAACGQNKNNPAAAKVQLKTSIDSFSYALGMSMASFYKQQGVTKINTAVMNKAIDDVMKNGKKAFTDDQANKCLNDQFTKIRAEKSASAKKEGDAFLAANKTKPGVVTTASGLQYQVIKEGTGPKPAETDKVKVHYHGTLVDGTVFDSSVDRGEPVTFPVNGVIPGWVEALQLMPVGSKWKLFIPSNLAYGDNGAGEKIKPGATLVFEVELLGIEK